MEAKVLANELCFNLRTHRKLVFSPLKQNKEYLMLTLCFISVYREFLCTASAAVKVKKIL
jgi:hypothetical protein